MTRLLVTLFVAWMVACTKAAERMNPGPLPVPPPPSPSSSAGAKSWLALGDSYTIGQSVGPGERFPAQTTAWLKQAGIVMADPDYIAATGWTSGDLSHGINTNNPSPHDVVSLLIGVNDEYQRHDTTGYRQAFTGLLIKSIELAGGKRDHVFVLSIPDYSVTPFAVNSDTARISREIDWFNAINKSVTDEHQCPYLNITPSTRRAKYDQSLIASDGLHPSGKEYRIWADSLGPMMKQALQ